MKNKFLNEKLPEASFFQTHRGNESAYQITLAVSHYLCKVGSATVLPIRTCFLPRTAESQVETRMTSCQMKWHWSIFFSDLVQFPHANHHNFLSINHCLLGYELTLKLRSTQPTKSHHGDASRRLRTLV
jgi:hypothetical protein